jgi:hypothetical protein
MDPHLEVFLGLVLVFQAVPFTVALVFTWARRRFGRRKNDNGGKHDD